MDDTVREIIVIAKAVIAGETGLAEGSMKLGYLGFQHSNLDHDPDFLPFAAINSDIGHLPFGSVRENWTSEALVKADLELRQIEEHYRPTVIEGCKNLIRKFDKSGV
ncbi:MAG TPA: DUF2489 domain-containing protein [Gammaproteobacteria bacterium]